ncbi:MAG TPA: ATP-binding protein [Pirellulales bacterium]|nr:ATP-binding protein [Pirellulales bacterium]
MRKLAAKWQTGTHWPKRLEFIEISGVRGWSGQRVSFGFPFIAIAGENGVGKSTILQAIASIYRSPVEDERSMFASSFFPDTPWDKIRNATIEYQVREGKGSTRGSIQKPTDRWRETPERRKRLIRFVDLRRIQAMASRVGYQRIAKALNKETNRQMFEPEALRRLSSIMGRTYDSAGVALSNVDENRWVPIASLRSEQYSGFHHGAGELALVDLLKMDFPKYSMVLIDEFKTSLHPRAQRRLVHELADLCRVHELQIVITTHSPYVMAELPEHGRMYIMNSPTEKILVAWKASNQSVVGDEKPTQKNRSPKCQTKS